MVPPPPPYAVRRQRVAVGRQSGEVLVAVFPLSAGAVCLQLQDEGPLRRGGVYLLERDDPQAAGIAPRIDELLQALRRVAESGGPVQAWRRLLTRAARAARATRPRLSPGALGRVQAVLRAGRAMEGAGLGLAPEALLAACLLLFVSEEERYPPPRFQGGQMLLGRLLEALGEGPSGGRA